MKLGRASMKCESSVPLAILVAVTYYPPISRAMLAKLGRVETTLSFAALAIAGRITRATKTVLIGNFIDGPKICARRVNRAGIRTATTRNDLLRDPFDGPDYIGAEVSRTR